MHCRDFLSQGECLADLPIPDTQDKDRRRYGTCREKPSSLQIRREAVRIRIANETPTLICRRNVHAIRHVAGLVTRGREPWGRPEGASRGLDPATSPAREAPNRRPWAAEDVGRSRPSRDGLRPYTGRRSTLISRFYTTSSLSTVTRLCPGHARISPVGRTTVGEGRQKTRHASWLLWPWGGTARLPGDCQLLRASPEGLWAGSPKAEGGGHAL